MPVPTPKNKKEFSWGRFSKTLSFWILILLIPVVLIQLSGKSTDSAKTITYTQYRDALDRDNIQAVKITAGKTDLVVGFRGSSKRRGPAPLKRSSYCAFLPLPWGDLIRPALHFLLLFLHLFRGMAEGRRGRDLGKGEVCLGCSISGSPPALY
jgi:hypothetical protein